jgi:hypothetical protein
MGKQNQLILDDNCYCGKYNQFSYYFKILYISLKLYFLIDINSGNFLICYKPITACNSKGLKLNPI